MESAVGNNAAHDHQAPAKHAGEVRAPQSEAKAAATETDALAACLELCGFLQDGLDGAQEMLGQTLILQQAMMDVFSRQIMGLPDSDQPNPAPEDMSALVGAMQTDDLMRQRHENLAQAMVAMSTTIKEVRALAAAAAGTGPSSDELRRRWTADMLKMLTLDEVRQGFERSLNTKAR